MLATNATFIAYSEPRRVQHPDGSHTITVRPQVWVRYFTAVKIDSIEVGGRRGATRAGQPSTIAVHLNPASVGLNEPITAYLDGSETAAADFLRKASQEGRPVSLALETIRKAKTKTTRDVISPLPPIHALRGASSASGARSKNMLHASGENIRNVVAMINNKPCKQIVTDPTEWPQLVDNKDGTLPPEGWVFLGPTAGQSWAEVGTIVEATASPVAPSRAGEQAPAAGVTADQISAIVTQAVREAMRKPAFTGFREGKPWDARTSDGRVNLASTLVTADAYEWRAAYAYLVEHAQFDDDVDLATVTGELRSLVVEIADQVQVQAYGGRFAVDRASASHKEARNWIRFVIRDLGHTVPLTAQGLDLEVLEAWAEEVGRLATGHLSATGDRVGRYLTDGGVQVSDRQPGPGQPSKLLIALLDAIVATWDNAEGLASLAQQASNRRLNEATVTIGANGDKVAYTISDSGRRLEEILDERIAELSTAQDDDALSYSPALHTIVVALGFATDLDTLKKIWHRASKSGELESAVKVTIADDGRPEVRLADYDGVDTQVMPLGEILEAQQTNLTRDAAAAEISPVDAIIAEARQATDTDTIDALVARAATDGLMFEPVDFDGVDTLVEALAAMRNQLA